MKLKMNFMELYNYFVMNMPNLCDDNCRNLIKSHEDDAQLGVDPVTEKYIAPFNLDHRYEQIIEWDTEIDSIAKNFDSIGDFNRKNLLYVVNGEKINKGEVKEILLATTCYQYKGEHEDYYKTHKYIGPLKELELHCDVKKQKPEEIDVRDVTIKDRTEWVHTDGRIYKVSSIPSSKPTLLKIVSDVYNLAVAFPFLVMRVYCFKYKYDSGYTLLDNNQDNLVASRIAHKMLCKEKFEENYIIGFSVRYGEVTVLNTEEAYLTYTEDV